MTSTSIICLKKEVESMLETLNTFGEFHIEPTVQDNMTLNENNQTIQQVQQRIHDLEILADSWAEKKNGVLGIFKTIEPKKVNVTSDNWQSLLNDTNQNVLSLKNEAESYNSKLNQLKTDVEKLNHLKKMLIALESTHIDLESLENPKLIYVAFASMPIKNCEPFQIATENLPLYTTQSRLAKEECLLILAAPMKYKKEIERILHIYHGEIFQLPKDLPHDVEKSLNEVDRHLKEYNEKEIEVQYSIKKLAAENKDKLSSWKENLENILALLVAEQKILQSGHLATLKGFVPQNRFNELVDSVNSMMEGKALVLVTNPEEALEVPPTKILHNRFIRPFEEITRLYGLPNYNEIDPTPFLAISFPILFGLMFGDLGHGLVLFIGGLTVGSLIKRKGSMKNICWIMAICGIAACITGLLFGEFFGLQVFRPLWFSPFHGSGVFNFLIFSLCIGIVQIASGIVIEMANYIVKHNLADAFLTAAPKMAFYLGGVYLIATCKLDFALWFNGAILVPLIPFIIMVAGKPLMLMTTNIKVNNMGNSHAQHGGEHAEQDTFTGRLFEGGDFLTRLLSNTISYSRILALLMAHWALLLVTYTVAGLINPSTAPTVIGYVLAGIVIVFGNIAVLALEGLIVFIHTLRLHFYEWFSKFYAGTGIEFTPFKQKHDNTILILKEDQASVKTKKEVCQEPVQN